MEAEAHELLASFTITVHSDRSEREHVRIGTVRARVCKGAKNMCSKVYQECHV